MGEVVIKIYPEDGWMRVEEDGKLIIGRTMSEEQLAPIVKLYEPELRKNWRKMKLDDYRGEEDRT